MINIEQDIQRIFKENECYYDWEPMGNDYVEIEVIWGDWKHDHLFLTHIMEKNGYVQMAERFTEDDGSDTYSSTHIFKYVGK